MPFSMVSFSPRAYSSSADVEANKELQDLADHVWNIGARLQEIKDKLETFDTLFSPTFGKDVEARTLLRNANRNIDEIYHISQTGAIECDEHNYREFIKTIQTDQEVSKDIDKALTESSYDLQDKSKVLEASKQLKDIIADANITTERWAKLCQFH